MPCNPTSGAAPGLPAARLLEIHDMLTMALDASENPGGYTPSLREARSYIRTARRHAGKLLEAVQ